MLAPNAPLRSAVTALAAETIAAKQSPLAEGCGEQSAETPHRSPARYLWARLLARIYEVFPLACPQCGTQMRIVAFITETAPVQRILRHIGESALPPRIAPARGPPSWEEEDCETIFLDEERITGDSPAQPEPAYQFDQRVSW